MEIPTTNPNLPHVSCSSDPVMGDAVVNFTLYNTDNDPATNNPDKVLPILKPLSTAVTSTTGGSNSTPLSKPAMVSTLPIVLNYFSQRW